MSTKLTPNATEVRTTRTTIKTDSAPFTFDPFNTNPTPDMFEDKWQAQPDDAR
jgi:hypothetical protein